MKSEHVVGNHTLIDEGHILFFRYVGDVTGDEVAELIAMATRTVTGRPPVYALADLRRLGSISGEARKNWTNWFRSHGFVAAACFGATFTTRTAAKMIVAAARAFSGFEPQFVFFGTEGEARAWIEKHRAAGDSIK
ncbi:MAG: hypothetical protein HUU21_37085 [Polyangiaceae bacterium]|nr:STAS/SEC14 domain-containing protein [Polyangiaceae bacterium]NUQ79163.1 hypothetical protein [Polyangiaceae bacterium]